MSTKKKNLKRKKTGTRKINPNIFQIKTFIFDMIKTTKKAEEIDEPVNTFLKTVKVKDEDKIMIEQGEGYVRISIIYRVRLNNV